jgi:hypothetical protein
MTLISCSFSPLSVWGPSDFARDHAVLSGTHCRILTRLRVKGENVEEGLSDDVEIQGKGPVLTVFDI